MTYGKILLIAIGLFSLTVQAQVEVISIPPNVTPLPIKKSSTSRIQSHLPLSLPFWDDFSSHLGYVDTTLWESSQSVHISNGAGIQPPSLNAVVFNGLDSLGAPYSSQDQIGFTDKLTSASIDLTSVSLAGRDSVYLNFYLQLGGNGELPDGQDFFQVEFKTNTGTWEVMQKFDINDIQDNTLFNQVTIKVADTKFFHNNFQFRFRSSGLQSGNYDTWVLDYVYLNDNRTDTWFSFPDRALATWPGPLFGKFYAMPYVHYRIDKPLDTIRFEVQNLRGGDGGDTDDVATSNYDAITTFTSYVGGSTFTNTVTTSNNDYASGVPILQPLERKLVAYDSLGKYTNQLNDLADSASIHFEIVLNSGDPTDITYNSFAPTDFSANDTVRMEYPLLDYYAFDDGTAEHGARLTQPGNKLAVRFEMPIDTATITGFWAYFPYVNGSPSENIEVSVYSDDNGLPAIKPLKTFNRTITKTRNNIFTHVALNIDDTVFVSGGVFYLGYKQPQSNEVVVGLDANNDTGDEIAIFTNSAWKPNILLHGSLMIRPIIGEGGNVIITGINEPRTTPIIYPNPNQGTFIISDNISEAQILDVTGRPVHFTCTQNSENSEFTIPSAAPGMYIVHWRNRQGRFVKKIQVVRP